MDEFFTPRILARFVMMSCVVVALIVTIQRSKLTKIVFCDVGQGDSTYIRTREGIDVLIDAGASRDVLECLGKEMPFYDKTIELAIVTHPHIDHYGGFLYVFESYSIQTFVMNDHTHDAMSYAKLENLLNITDRLSAFQGEHIELGRDVEISVLWPKSSIFSRAVQDKNEYSVVLEYSESNFRMLLTGDAPPHVLRELSRTHTADIKDISLLKVPHHGSHNGLTGDVLQVINPEYSVISVGDNNRYGHPSKSVLSMLEEGSYEYDLTADKGSISILVQTDGTFVQSQ